MQASVCEVCLQVASSLRVPVKCHIEVINTQC